MPVICAKEDLGTTLITHPRIQRDTYNQTNTMRDRQAERQTGSETEKSSETTIRVLCWSLMNLKPVFVQAWGSE